jgi:predicted lysophospholipase L1 biosynthesis ABC-type transport system permease subunit
MSDGCFEALEIPLIAGRGFTRRETEGVAIVSASVARDLWPDQTDVLDRRLHIGLRTGPLLRVVGIVPDIRLGSLETLERGQVWTPSSRGWPQPQRLMLRTGAPPATLIGPVRDVLNRLAPELALANVRTTDDIVVSATASRRFMLVLLGSFAIIAVVLCAVGIYGVLAHQVGQRTREIGIRMALGAGSASVLQFVVRLVLTGVMAGVIVGMAGAWALSSVLSTQLFEMSATDPRVYGAVAGLVLLVALVAALPPTRRAICIEPLNALRE